MKYREVSDALESFSDHQKAGMLHFMLGAISHNDEFMDALVIAMDEERRLAEYIKEQRQKAKGFKL